MKVDSIRVGVAVAIVWAFGVILLGLMVSLLNWGALGLSVIASGYLGYGPSFGGIVIGAIWALVDGFIFGFLLGWVYNLLPKMGNI